MKTTYLHCTLLDGSENMTEQKDMTIVVEDGKILSVEPAAPAPSDSGTIIDLGGKYLMPGLINLHVHLPGSGYPRKKPQDSARAAKLVMKNGLTRALGRNYEKSERAEKAVAKLREKYGYETVQRGIMLEDARLASLDIRGKKLEKKDGENPKE